MHDTVSRTPPGQVIGSLNCGLRKQTAKIISTEGKTRNVSVTVY